MTVGSGDWLGLTPDSRFTETIFRSACVGSRSPETQNLPITHSENGLRERLTARQRLFLDRISFLSSANVLQLKPSPQR
jgi:hypothetical protein